ncbi:MAG: IGHMBP2 family helicase, partial [Candidatus Thermoplasmatota archaeon]|nr:IGHMBP2 family helicase [Candidatus Thermoplasmatota archaeon]
SAASQALEEREFDLCVIDEATQSTEPSCLIPAVKSDKLIMAGDHKQLPPTILNKEAKEEGLSETMFERLIALFGDDIKTLLRVQYRMHEKIMRFSDEQFYQGRVVADESVREHTLSDIIGEGRSGKFAEVLDPNEPLILLDTDHQMPERSKPGSTSKENPGEALLAKEISQRFLKMGLEPRDIGIITPYDDQTDLIERKIEKEEIEVDTVDGFQGREKEVIILSLTRSNDRDNIGFLKDLRRLNVSITRAKRKLVVLGDTETLSTHPVYEELFDYIEKEGRKVEVSI